VAHAVDLLLAELALFKSVGPHFRILHRYREPGTVCMWGEEIAGVYLVHRAREFVVPLSTTLRLLFDFLARHTHLPQSATQIAAAMSTDPFYRRHGARASGPKLTRRIGRASVKELVKRIRQALAQAFREANMAVDAETVLLSDKTVSNEVGYRLKATVEVSHVDHPGRQTAY
jgi:hypothetical protein